MCLRYSKVTRPTPGRGQCGEEAKLRRVALGAWTVPEGGRRHKQLCFPSLEYQSLPLPAHWTHGLSHTVPPKPTEWGVTLLSRFRSRCELEYLVGRASSLWALLHYVVSTNAFTNKSAQPNDSEQMHNCSLRTVQSGYGPHSRCDWCQPLGNSEVTFILSTEGVKAHNHTGLENASEAPGLAALLFSVSCLSPAPSTI